MTSNVVSPRKKTGDDARQLPPEQAAAAAMVAEAKARGLELIGPNGVRTGRLATSPSRRTGATCARI